ncbi:tripeptidyl peptidase precursor [Apiospora kogelbergensis]|uniref:tripeptidyl-peptidase II n=1 Tax=Apiospora kogelbergensis TaxID=1337665 RepID=A0AAW0QGR7_9PEZI
MRLAYLLLALSGFSFGAVVRERHLLAQVRELPQGWEFERKADAGDKMTLSIHLRQPQMAALRDRLDIISDPKHVEYGSHLTRKGLSKYRLPDPNAVESVTRWLKVNGVINTKVREASVDFSAPVSVINHLFSAEVTEYSFKGSLPSLRSLSHSIPAHLADHVDLVHPLSHFTPPVHKRHTPPNAAVARDLRSRQDQACPSTVTPVCLRQLFGLSQVPKGSPNASLARIGVAGFLDQYVHYADTDVFFQKYAPYVIKDSKNMSSSDSFDVVLLNGGQNPQQPSSGAGTEASLDVEYAAALGWPSRVTYFSTGGRGVKLDEQGAPSARSDNEPYLELLEHLLGLPDGSPQFPHVLSVSYADDEQSVPRAYARRVCDQLAQLAARGTTVVVATGDGGVRGTGQAAQCVSNDGLARPMFIPTFPASCPYVTAVGATLASGGPPFEAASFSAGGFSNYFAVPAWQRRDAASYVAAMGPAHAGFYNATGRAVPDLSTIGINYLIQWAGLQTSILGTSASTPVIAALVALIDNARLEAGRPSLGWLNPALYTSAEVRAALDDVVGGTSRQCVYLGDVELGYEATKGYDCVTGLGSIGAFDKLYDALYAVEGGK